MWNFFRELRIYPHFLLIYRSLLSEKTCAIPVYWDRYGQARERDRGGSLDVILRLFPLFPLIGALT
jgi:hypothetical protein